VEASVVEVAADFVARNPGARGYDMAVERYKVITVDMLMEDVEVVPEDAPTCWGS